MHVLAEHALGVAIGHGRQEARGATLDCVVEFFCSTRGGDVAKPPQSLAENAGRNINALTPSLRAKRSNPARRARDTGLLRRFASRNDELKHLIWWLSF
jgi:hypothetical protein